MWGSRPISPRSSRCEWDPCGRETLSGAGTSSDQPLDRTSPGAGPAGQPSVQKSIRVTNLYATAWQVPAQASGGELANYLELWRFERYYRLSADQLPQVLDRK